MTASGRCISCRLYDALSQSTQIRHILARHEQAHCTLGDGAHRQ
ncbi:hypothetical protein ACLK19_24765 [Escherichia coli]